MSDPSSCQQREHARITQQHQTSMSAHHIESASQILVLPAELRLVICSYMTLSPADFDSVAWKGAYFTCRQLHKDMRKQLKPEQDFKNYVKNIRPSLNHVNHNLRITIGLELPQFHLIREVTFHAPGLNLYIWSCCRTCLRTLYALYLDRLNILLTGDNFAEFGWSRSCEYRSEFFAKVVSQGEANCKTVTFTIEMLANKAEGRDRLTTFVLTVPGQDIPYLMEVVQDRDGNQTERVYLSENRFKLHDTDWRGPGIRFETDDLDFMLSDCEYETQ